MILYSIERKSHKKVIKLTVQTYDHDFQRFKSVTSKWLTINYFEHWARTLQISFLLGIWPITWALNVYTLHSLPTPLANQQLYQCLFPFCPFPNQTNRRHQHARWPEMAATGVQTIRSGERQPSAHRAGSRLSSTSRAKSEFLYQCHTESVLNCNTAKRPPFQPPFRVSVACHLDSVCALQIHSEVFIKRGHQTYAFVHCILVYVCVVCLSSVCAVTCVSCVLQYVMLPIVLHMHCINAFSIIAHVYNKHKQAQLTALHLTIWTIYHRLHSPYGHTKTLATSTKMRMRNNYIYICNTPNAHIHKHDNG